MCVLEEHKTGIRFAQKKDMPQLVALCKRHAEYEKAEYDPKNKVELLSEFIFGQNPLLTCLVAEQENSIVGYATCMKQFSTWDADFYIYLDCLYLEENVRGQGMGTLLMKKIKQFAKMENCSVIQWQTPSDNQKAIDFYQKIGGFSKTKERFRINI